VSRNGGRFEAGADFAKRACPSLAQSRKKPTKVILSSQIDESTDIDLKLESARRDRHNKAY
jgi:hypothetical protein